MSVQFSVDVARTALQDAQVGPEVQKIGVSFRSLPPDAVVVNSVAPETWGQGRFRGGEEVVAVNGIDVATMDRENFKEALKVRPLTIRFRVPVDSKDELHTAVADSSIDKIGLSFLQLPPEPVLVNKVISDSWAEQAGFEGGEEIVIVNGREVSSMTSDEFKASLKERPLALRFRIDALPDGVEELLVGEDVDKIGLSFLQLPPDPVFVNKVVSGTWADEQGFTGGEEILALDGESVDAMSPESFKVALKRRPLTLRFRLPESDGPMDVTADASVQKIGLTFTQLPPEPVVVSKVASGTWAENVGFRGGEEIVAVNGLDCIAMGQHEFKALLKSRPLTLRFFPPEDPQETASKDGKVGTLEQQREKAALKIQAVQRGKVARKATAEEKKQKEEAARKIQAVQRGKAARAAMAESTKEQPASKKAAPETEASPKDKTTAGARTEQKKKPSKSGKTDPEEQQREEAALKIQAVQRGKAARKATAEEKKQKEEAAMKIQAVQRGKAARAAMAESRKEQPASKKAMPKPKAPPKDKTTAGARTEQKKKPSKSGKTDPEEQQREETALKIQAVQRGKAARKATAEEKKQKEEAAMKIQAVQRGKAARAAMAESSKDQPASKNAVPKPKAPPNDKTTAGATADQKAPFLESLEEEQNLTVEEQKQREEAAVKIQAVQRGKAARKATAEEKKEKEEAATKIQAVQRGKAARAAMAEGSNEQRASDEASQKPKAPPKDKTAADATAEQKKRPSKKQQDKGVPKPKAQQKCKTGGAVPSVQKRPCSTEAVPGVVEELTAEEEKQREEAAVKIQAVHRGKAARAAMAESSTGQPASRKTGSKRKSSKGYAAATATSEQKRQSRKKVDRNSQEDANSSKDGSRSPRRSASVGPTLSTAQRAGRQSQRNSEDPESEAPRSPSRCSQGKLDDAKSRESSRSASARSGSKSPKSPKSRPRGSLLSLGDADVHLSFRVNGLDDILAEHAMTTEYEEALKRVIVQQAGAGLQTKHLQLKSSGAKVNAKISAPPTVPRAMLHSCLANSSGALSAALEEELASSIAALEGRGREALSVEGLELRFGEVSRNSSILDTSGRFAVWPGGCLSEDSPTPKSTSRQRSGARSAAPRREASSRPASPRTPRTPRAGSEAALSRFRSELLRRGGTYAAAWRRILDCAGHGYLSFAEFCDACRRMSYSGNVKDAWHALDADGSGKVTLCELHWATAEALSRFVASLQSSFGGLEMAAKALGRGGRRLRKEEFRSWMQEQQVLSASEADSIFKMICSDSTMSRPSVRAEDIDWLAHLLPHLPLPKGRVPPGASVAETTVDLPEGPDAPQTATAARTPRSASQPARRPLQDGEDLYDRLHREAKDYHARKKEKHEKEGLFRPPGTPPETKACGNTVHLEKLYKMGQMQKRKQEKMADEYYAQLLGNRHKKKVPDEEVWARLQAKREVREVKSEPEDKPKEQTKHKGPSRPPPSGSVKEASERLYAAARKIESKKKELAERADQETRSKEEELKKKVGPITKAREVEIVKRLHREDQQKREEESMKRQQEKEAQEEEIRRLAVRKQGKVRPETFFRLHLDRLQREETLAEKRRMKEQQEEKKLKAESIHNRSTHNPRVFHRLYQSKGRPMEVLQTWLQPGVPTDAEEDAAYSGSETFEDETTSRASRPPERTARREPAREAARTRREGAPKAEPGEAEEDDFREMLSGHRQKADLVPKVALDDLNGRKGPTGQAPGTATSSRIPPGERTEWNGGDESHDEIDGLVRISRRPLGSLRPSSAPRRSVAADLSRELFGDSNDEEPLPSHSSHLRNAGAWDAMTEMISWDKEP